MELLETTDLIPIVKKALKRSFDPQAYDNLMKTYAVEGKTTGPVQKEDLIYYTKLNAQRTKRIQKTVPLNQALASKIRAINDRHTWVILTESWCGDAANSIPVLDKLADENPNINVYFVLRDANPELMDQFLTNGSRSIPKLIALDERYEVQFTWGPRPKAAQDLYDGWRNMENRPPYKEFQVEMQKWYNADKGQSLQLELLGLIPG